MEEFFAGVKTVQAAHKRYKKLAMTYHPDVSSHQDATHIMAEVNRQYKSVLVRLEQHQEQQKQHQRDKRSQEHPPQEPQPKKSTQHSEKKRHHVEEQEVPIEEQPKKSTSMRVVEVLQDKRIANDVDRIVTKTGDLVKDVVSVGLDFGFSLLRQKLSKRNNEV